MIALAVFFLLWAMILRGDRNDALSAILGLLVVYGLIRGRPFSLRIKSVVIILSFMLLIDLYGSVRSLDFNSISFDNVTSIIVNQRLSSDVVNFGTVSAIASTFSNAVWMIENETIDLAFGRSYLEFVPRTWPEVLYTNRPQDYALMFKEHDLRTGGGFFELAEAYMNFGLVGCFAIPFLISTFISRIFSNVLIKQDIFSYLMLIGLLSVFLRATWYQTFAFYRGVTLAIAIYVILWVVHQLVFCLKSQQRAPVVP